jgi:peptidoglycan/LPS O-acetylase OafA/YrhL
MIKSTRISNLLMLLSKYSFGIYLSHVLILKLIVQILNHIGITHEHVLFYIISFIGTMALSVFFCFVVEKTILSKYMLGINQAQKSYLIKSIFFVNLEFFVSNV